jgi:hypothetical protein
MIACIRAICTPHFMLFNLHFYHNCFIVMATLQELKEKTKSSWSLQTDEEVTQDITAYQNTIPLAYFSLSFPFNFTFPPTLTTTNFTYDFPLYLEFLCIVALQVPGVLLQQHASQNSGNGNTPVHVPLSLPIKIPNEYNMTVTYYYATTTILCSLCKLI